MNIRSGIRTPLVVIVALVLGIAGDAGAGDHHDDRSSSFQAAGSVESMGAVDTATARLFFERFKGLSGAWKARSTRGWEATTRIRTIAGGSAVMMTSFDAHPNETMVTMLTLDQGRLLMTHYCVAGNQPRLMATGANREHGEVEFTFLDGGNLPSRDRGHMDRAIYRFIDANRFWSRWTWFQNGRERWLEEIDEERVTEPASTTGR